MKDGILVLSIGDIHGEDLWKKLGDIDDLLNIDTAVPQYDKYVFVGDYVDSYTKSNIAIIDNLNNIIAFKKKFPDNVVLLVGNHDEQYIKQNSWLYRCSGFRPEMYVDLHEIFTKNKNLFQLAYGYGKMIWTHAGVHDDWYKKTGTSCYHGDAKKLAEALNNMYLNNITDIFDVGYIRGGMFDVGGPLWLDKSRLYREPLNGYDQIVGHTNVMRIESYNINSNLISFVDALTQWNYRNPVVTEKAARQLVMFINK